MSLLGERIKHAWNAFMNKDPTEDYVPMGPAYSIRQDRPRLTRGNERSMINSIITRIAIDVASLKFAHVKVDEDGRYLETIDDSLNSCLNLEANIDQTGRAFIQDVVMSMLDEGTVGIAPIDTYGSDPQKSDAYEIRSWRTGKITQWFPQDVKINLYDDRRGLREELRFRKRSVAIIENPLYSVMNEPNSTLQRLIRKLNLLDVVEEQSGSGKLDLIIQLPYVIKTQARRDQAENRRKDIEQQLSSSKYGIAYTDGTEHITQLNRAVENNLLKSVEYWTNQLFAQLGMTNTVFDGTADEKTMLNYQNRTVEPIAAAITDELTRKFLSATARTKGDRVLFFKDPFKLVPVEQIAEIADKFTRNEITTSNEIRQAIGMKPSKDPKADELRNSNIAQPEEDGAKNDVENGTVRIQNETKISDL